MGTHPSIKYKIRPDRTTIVFANKIKELFHDVPIVIGGLEATLRCFAHYDFQQDRIRRSILLDSRADILVAGMGEKQLVKIARSLESGVSSDHIMLAGTAKTTDRIPEENSFVELPSFEAVSQERTKLLEAHLIIERASLEGKGIAQRHADRYVVKYPAENYNSSDLEHVYAQDYTRMHLKKRFLLTSTANESFFHNLTPGMWRRMLFLFDWASRWKKGHLTFFGIYCKGNPQSDSTPGMEGHHFRYRRCDSRHVWK